MPLYRVHSHSEKLTPEQRRTFSQDVVDVHCHFTQAPPSFVHVLYMDGPIPDGFLVHVLGTIRSGRTASQKQSIIDGLAARYAAHAGIDSGQVTVTLIDIEASSVMEGGKLLPEPGSEEERRWTA
ncbi:MAG: tautomerase family protein [Acidobacteriota bacterium]